MPAITSPTTECSHKCTRTDSDYLMKEITRNVRGHVISELTQQEFAFQCTGLATSLILVNRQRMFHVALCNCHNTCIPGSPLRHLRKHPDSSPHVGYITSSPTLPSNASCHPIISLKICSALRFHVYKAVLHRRYPASVPQTLRVFQITTELTCDKFIISDNSVDVHFSLLVIIENTIR